MPADTDLLSNRPLSESVRDRHLLVGREEAVRQVVRSPRYGVNTIVFGTRGIGKTSFLHTCQWELQKQGRRTILVNGTYPENALDLLDQMAYQLQFPREDYLAGAADLLNALTRRREVVGGPDKMVAAIRNLRSQLEKRGEPEGGREVVIVDEPRPDAAHGLFGRARDELWTLPLVWLVSADKARRADYLKPPADTFFEKVVELAPLDDAQAHRVLETRAPAALTPDIAQRIVGQAQGNPRRLISLAIETVMADTDDVSGTLDRADATFGILADLGPSAKRMWDALAVLNNQAAANDPALLSQLGWSRVRASQVLNQLEKAGLVDSTTEKTGQGRPRKVYRATGVHLGLGV